MGDTDSRGEDGGHSDPSSRSRHSGHRAAPPTGRARGLLYEKYYRSLLQLAALLTGDAVIAEAVVVDALAAISPSATSRWSTDDCLRDLQRLVLIRCRRTGRYRRLSARHGQHAASDFARLPVVMALLGLPRSAREAVVLIHYLDLPAPQAAAIAGISEALLAANLASAMLALDDQFTEPSPDS